MDLMPEEAEVFYFVKKKLFDVFKLYGFSVVAPSSIELIDTYLSSGEKEANTFNFIDHYEGKTACFRYDFTPQIARILASSKTPLPARFCYEGSVLRNPEGLSGVMREIYHAGVELIGIEGEDAEAELVLMLVRLFKELGMGGFKIFLSDANICSRIFGGGAAMPAELKKAFINKDLSEIKKIASRLDISSDKKRFLQELGFLCGDKDVLDYAGKKHGIDEVMPYIGRLKRLYDAVEPYCAGRIFFDLGEVRGFEYHTGIMFDCYAQDKNGNDVEIITGGRYDNLLKNFCGEDIPATGFAVDIFNLSRCAAHEKSPAFLIAYDSNRRKKRALKLAEDLRNKGFAVTVDFSTSKEHSEKRQFDYGIMLRNNDTIVVDFKTGKEKKLTSKI